LDTDTSLAGILEESKAAAEEDAGSVSVELQCKTDDVDGGIDFKLDDDEDKSDAEDGCAWSDCNAAGLTDSDASGDA
jgi:hypothetical protein